MINEEDEKKIEEMMEDKKKHPKVKKGGAKFDSATHEMEKQDKKDDQWSNHAIFKNKILLTSLLNHIFEIFFSLLLSNVHGTKSALSDKIIYVSSFNCSELNVTIDMFSTLGNYSPINSKPVFSGS